MTALADAIVVLTGSHLQLVQTSDHQGAFRFESLTPGVYRVAAGLPGFDPPSSGQARGERLIEVKGGETIDAADDLGGDPRTLTLQRRYAAAGQDHILAVADDPLAPTKIRLVGVAERRFTSVFWFVKSDVPSELTQGDRRTLSLLRPGLYPVELWLQQPADENEGRYRKIHDTLVVGPLGARVRPDKPLEIVPAESISQQMRDIVVGSMVGGEPSRAEAGPQAGSRRLVLQGASAGGPMVGAGEGVVRGRGIRLEVGPVSAYGPEVNP